MYTLTIGNSFHYTLTVDADVSRPVPPGQSITIPVALGDAIVTVPGIGQMLIQDIGDRQIGGYSKATWGVFLAYQGEEVVFRYEGGGQLKVTFNDLAQAEIETNGGVSRISLGAFILPG